MTPPTSCCSPSPVLTTGAVPFRSLSAPGTSPSLPGRRQPPSASRAWSLFRRSLPFRLLTVEIIRSPKFLGGSLYRHALLYDPALVSTRSAFHRVSFLPSARTHGVGFPRTCRISGFHDTAYLLAVYASPQRSPSAVQHSLSAGGHLCRTGFGPAGPSSKGFRFELTSSSASPFPWLTLAHASSPAGVAASRAATLLPSPNC
jgi:hypothetical protein